MKTVHIGARRLVARGIFRFKLAVRLVLAHMLYYSGVLHVLKRRRLRGRAVVLMYHRVLTEQERSNSFSSDGIQVSPRSFDRQLKFLRRHFNVLSPDQFAQRLNSGQAFDDASCLVTFDDGWRDNFTNALPLLRKHSIPTVIFLPTDLIGSDRCFWQESLARSLYRLHAARKTSLAAQQVVAAHELTDVLAADGDELKERIHDYVRALKMRPQDEVQRLMDVVNTAIGAGAEVKPHPDRFLTWDEVRTMAGAGVTFGSHAVTHRVLTRLPKADVVEELAASRQAIAARAGIDAELLAYPNGDCNEETADAARQTGYKAAFITSFGTVAAGDNPYLVNRINIHDRATRTVAGFYASVLGVL